MDIKFVIIMVFTLIVLEKRTVSTKTVVLSDYNGLQPDVIHYNYVTSKYSDSGVYCDGVECPSKTKRCVVRKDSIPGKAELLIRRICKDSQGRELYEEAKTLPQLDGPEDYHSISETSVGGEFSFQTNYLSKDDELLLKNELLSQAKAFEEQTKNIGASIKNAISKAIAGLFQRTNFPTD